MGWILTLIYYRDAIPTTEATFYKGESHFIMYSRAEEILNSLTGTQR